MYPDIGLLKYLQVGDGRNGQVGLLSAEVGVFIVPAHIFQQQGIHKTLVFPILPGEVSLVGHISRWILVHRLHLGIRKKFFLCLFHRADGTSGDVPAPVHGDGGDAVGIVLIVEIRIGHNGGDSL